MRARRALRGSARGAAAAFLLVVAVGGCGGKASSTTTATRSAASYTTLIDAGVHLLRTGNTNAAQQLFQQAIAKRPQAPLAHYDLALVDQQMGLVAPALAQYRRVLALAPRYVPAVFNMAVLLTSSQPAVAKSLYRRAIELQPDAPTAFLNLGLLETQQRSTRSAGLADLRRAIRLDPPLAVRIPASLRSELRPRKG